MYVNIYIQCTCTVHVHVRVVGVGAESETYWIPKLGHTPVHWGRRVGWGNLTLHREEVVE